MKDVWLEDPLGERKLLPSELPLTVGGPGAAVVIPGCRPGELRARVALTTQGLAVTPEPGAGSDALDGVSIALEDRDGRATIVVRHGGVANVTRPPVLESRAADAGAGDRQPIEIVPYEPRAARQAGRPPAKRGLMTPLRWAAVALVGIVLLYLFSATAVQVGSNPETDLDRVDFSGTSLDIGFGGRYLVPPGQYELLVEAEGYAPARQSVTVGPQSGQEFVVALERLPGKVAFDTGGVAATLAVDGAIVGKVPGEFELKAGPREISIAAQHFAEERLSLDVKGGGERQALKVRLKPLYARVTVNSVPAGATVWADDRELGPTPLETELDAGRYTLAIVHPDFRRFESPITVVAGEPLAVGPIELGMPDGRLAVSSRPAGADVSIGGRYRGRTPLTVSVPPGMPQEVLLTLAGYAPATQSVAVESRAERRIAVDLKAVLGDVRVTG